MELQRSENIGKLAEALAKAQGAYGALKRNRTVDYVTKTGAKIKYSYAELSEVLDICRKPLSDNGLAILQPSRIENGQAIVLTLLMHSSGEWISSELAITCAGHSPQEEGGALTYARRYGLSATLGLASEPDDDAQAAQEATKSQGQQAKPPVQAVRPTSAEPIAKQAAVGATEPVAASAPAQPMQQAAPGPTTIQELVKQAMDQYGLPPSVVAREAAAESTARIPTTDIPRIWAQISSGKYPRKQPSLTK